MKVLKLCYVVIVMLACMLLVIACSHAGRRVDENKKKVSNNLYDENSQYQKKVSLDKMNLTNLNKSIFNEPSDRPYDFSKQGSLTLKRTIRYYAIENGKKTVKYELKKGTDILWNGYLQYYISTVGYGLTSYPTYEKGWRYVRPFLTPGHIKDFKNLPYYYVKLKDLDYVAVQLLKSKTYSQDWYQHEYIVQNEFTIYKYLLRMTRYIDTSLYQKGIYCSPDLLQDVWQREDYIFIGLSIALIVAGSLLYHETLKLFKKHGKSNTLPV